MTQRDQPRPSGWVWFPRREYHGPLDANYVQHKWLRLYHPGPVRVLVTGLCALATMLIAAISITLATQSRGLLAIGAVGLVSLAMLWGAATFTIRVLSGGVYVTDFGVRLLTLRSARVIPWVEIVDVRRVAESRRPLGLLPKRAAQSVLMVTKTGDDLDSHVNTVNADFLGRPEAYDIAALSLERWWRDGTSHTETGRSR